MAWTQKDKEPNERLRALADMASDLRIDPNIPIRRYYRSGSEMLKMAEIYYKEDNLESAYILFFKYVTLHIDKIRHHPDYKDVLPAEKKKVNHTVKVILSESEKIKADLRRSYEGEYEEFLRVEAIKAAEEEERKRREEKALQEKFHNEREKMMAIERDREVALWHQAQIDKEMKSNSFGQIPPPPDSTKCVPKDVVNVKHSQKSAGEGEKMNVVVKCVPKDVVNVNDSQTSSGRGEDEKMNVTGKCVLKDRENAKDSQIDVKDSQIDDTNSSRSTVMSVDDYSHLCWSCSKTKTEVKLHTCGGCRKARYCSKECLEEDWPEHGYWCLNHCWGCEKTKREVKLFHCAGCKKAKYCSRGCIEQDWPHHQNWCLEQ